jgi:hypothetical protein
VRFHIGVGTALATKKCVKQKMTNKHMKGQAITMSVLSDKVYQRQMHHRHYHSAISRHHQHYVVDFIEWLALFGTIGFIVADPSRLDGIVRFVISLLG